VFLYRFNDTDPGNTIYLIAKQEYEEKFLRSQMSHHDHGGMNYEDFQRVWQNGPIELITSLEQVPIADRGIIPYAVDELDDEGDWFDFDNDIQSLNLTVPKEEKIPHQAKEITREEARYLFLKYMVSLVNYWHKEAGVETRDKLEGLLHSILTTLDGGAMALPGYHLLPCTDEGDKPYAIENGYDYYPHVKDLPSYDIGGGLHEEMYKYIRGEVKKPDNLYHFGDHLIDEGKKMGWINES